MKLRGRRHADPDRESWSHNSTLKEQCTMRRHRRLMLSLALSFLVGVSATGARAASISMTIDLSVGPTIIVDVFTSGGTATDYGTVNLALLNATLSAAGSAYQFSALGGQSNF